MARDTYHQPIKEALSLAGWTVADDYQLQFGRRRLFVDLHATLLSAERATEKIAVEVKDFALMTPMGVIYQAIGQYLVYKSLLARKDPDRILYLGVSESAYQRLFRQPELLLVAQDYGIRLLVINIKERRIVAWR